MPESRTTRQEFLGRVSRALGRRGIAKTVENKPDVDVEMVRLAGEDDSVVDMFCDRAAFTGMDVRRCKKDEFVETVVGILDEVSARKVTTSIENLDDAVGLRKAIREGGVKIAKWTDDRTMGAHYGADVGITDVHCALAETGTLICCSGAKHGRGGSLVPEIHLALVRKKDIAADMLDYFDQIEGLDSKGLPSSQAFITGPSKTADIEGVMITGVHGPRRVIILVVEDD